MSRVRMRSAALATAAIFVAACGRASAPYRVAVDVGPAIRALASDDLGEASAAEDRVLALGDDALPALARALRREDAATRVAVVEALAQVPGDASAPLLVHALRHDGSDEVRAEAAFALRDGKAEIVEPALVHALDDPSADVRRNAALACGAACRSTASIERVVRLALDDRAPAVWWAARGALRRLGGDRGATHAAAVASSVRAQAPDRLAGGVAGGAFRAALLLADVGDARGATVLLAAVADDGDAGMRQQAVTALGEVGDADAVQPLCAALRDPLLAPLAEGALARAAARGVAGPEAARSRCPRVRRPGSAEALRPRAR